MAELTQEQKLEVVLNKASQSLVHQYKIFMAGDNYVKPSGFHFTLSDILLNEKGHFAIEAFRESAKTSYVLQSFPTYCLQFPCEERSYVVFIKQNQKQAEQKLKEVRDNYMTNPNLNFNMISIKEQSASVFEAVVQGRDMKPVNVRFEAYGKTSPVRGLSYTNKRPQIVILDDVQDIDDARSPTAIDRDYNWFMSDVLQLGKSTRIFMIGNNLGDECLIEKVIRASESLGFSTLKIPAINEKGEATWEEQFSKEFLEQERQQFTDRGDLNIWLRERMCQSVQAEAFIFKKDYFQYYQQHEIDTSRLKIVTACDPAISQKQSADDTAIITIGMDYQKRIYVLDMVVGKYHPDEIINLMFQQNRKWSPSRIGIENVSYQKMLIQEMRKQMRLRQNHIPLEELKPKGKKEERIKSSLQPRYANFDVYHLKEHPNNQKLESQLLAIRTDDVVTGVHDDIPDALSYAVDMLSIVDEQTKAISYKNEDVKTEYEDKTAEQEFAEAFPEEFSLGVESYS